MDDGRLNIKSKAFKILVGSRSWIMGYRNFFWFNCESLGGGKKTVLCVLPLCEDQAGQHFNGRGDTSLNQITNFKWNALTCVVVTKLPCLILKSSLIVLLIVSVCGWQRGQIGGRLFIFSVYVCVHVKARGWHGVASVTPYIFVWGRYLSLDPGLTSLAVLAAQ